MIETSQELDKLFAALAKAQGELEPAIKDATNPAFARGANPGSKYADLAGCMKVIKAALPKHGLCLTQMYGGPEVVTMLGHESGQWIRGSITIPHFDSLNPQQIGSATTYLRRYSLGIVGLVSDIDDDGNAASGKTGTVVDPRGQDRPAQDDKTVQEYVKRFTVAMENPDDMAAAADVFAIHNEVAHKHELYMAIGDALGTKYKNSIRKFVAMAKQKDAA